MFPFLNQPRRTDSGFLGIIVVCRQLQRQPLPPLAGSHKGCPYRAIPNEPRSDQYFYRYREL